MNEFLVRLGVVEGECHGHRHDEEDDSFYAVSGHLIIELLPG
ncbi:hypothetical protein [Saccharomonospora xinjiangensis]|nr:hypothetical protein [Saccharomonospora xinjiangensis]